MFGIRREIRRRGFLWAALILAATIFTGTASASVKGTRFHSHPRAHRAASFHGHISGGRWGWGWNWGWYSPWWGWGYYGYPGYPRSGRVYGGNWTAVKTDVEPDEAALYLDGKLIGTADDFDGFPDQLYLKPGRYALEFRLDGYESYSVTIDASGGRRFDVDYHLKKIPGAKQYGTYSPAEPPGGIVRYFAKRGGASEPYTSHDVERYRRAPAPERESAEEGEDSGSRNEAEAPPGGEDSAPAEASLHFFFEVAPADSAIYVDSRFAGTARELNNLAGGLEVSPGEHRITVVCPGYREKTISVKAEEGEPHRIRLRLSR